MNITQNMQQKNYSVYFDPSNVQMCGSPTADALPVPPDVISSLPDDVPVLSGAVTESLFGECITIGSPV